MKRGTVIIALALVLAIGICNFAAYAETAMTITLNGKPVATDVAPFIDSNSRTMVPVRFVSEALEAKVGWDGNTRLVTVTKGPIEIKLTIGSNIITVNGKATTMDTAAITKDNRTFVPVRYIAEALGLKVGWDGVTRTVILTGGETPPPPPTPPDAPTAPTPPDPPDGPDGSDGPGVKPTPPPPPTSPPPPPPPSPPNK